MENYIESILKTLLDYYVNFAPDSRITRMVQEAGKEADSSARARVLDGEDIDIAAAGDMNRDAQKYFPHQLKDDKKNR
jgi:hypothetical protein